MGVSRETLVAEAFISQRFAAVPALTAAGGGGAAAPQSPSKGTANIALPGPWWVVDQLNPREDTAVANGMRLWANLLYVVKLLVQGQSMTPYAAHLAALDDALHRQAEVPTSATLDGGVVVSGLVYYCRRLRPYSMVDTSGTETWTADGAIFELRVAGY